MPKFIILNNNIVTNTILADNQDIAMQVSGSNSVINAQLVTEFDNGWIWIEEENKFIPPIPMPSDGKDYIWSKNLFNWVEKPLGE